MPHLETFARLHVAGPNDPESLRALSLSLRDHAGSADRDWCPNMLNRDTRVVIATECGIAVGAAEMLHSRHSAIATLVWLGVQPDSFLKTDADEAERTTA